MAAWEGSTQLWKNENKRKMKNEKWNMLTSLEEMGARKKETR